MPLMNKRPIVLVDGMNAAYRAFHSHGGLSTSSGRSVAMIYGLLNIIQNIKKTFNPMRLVIIWDGAKSAHRLKEWPEYKSHRAKLGFDVEDFYAQRDIARKMFYFLGIPQVHHPDVEADDFICKYALKWAKWADEVKSKRKIVIVSGDKDFGQLITKRIYQWVPSKGKLYNPINFKTEFGHSPEQVVDFLCLTGDKSDNIPGYGGIGEVRANEFLKAYSSIDNYYELKVNGKINKDKLLPVYERNRKLIDLRLFNENHLSEIPLRYHNAQRKPAFNWDKYLKLAHKMEIKTFTTKQFKALFE